MRVEYYITRRLGGVSTEETFKAETVADLVAMVEGLRRGKSAVVVESFGLPQDVENCK